jgi:hypothetical protein
VIKDSQAPKISDEDKNTNSNTNELVVNTDYTNNLKVLYLNNGFTPKDIKDIESEIEN